MTVSGLQEHGATARNIMPAPGCEPAWSAPSGERERHVEGARAVGDRAEGREIGPGFGVGADGGERDSARGFDPDAGPKPARPRGPRAYHVGTLIVHQQSVRFRATCLVHLGFRFDLHLAFQSALTPRPRQRLRESPPALAERTPVIVLDKHG